MGNNDNSIQSIFNSIAFYRIEVVPRQLYRNPRPDLQQATVARKNSALKGRNLEQNQAQLGGSMMMAGWSEREVREDRKKRENTLIMKNNYGIISSILFLSFTTIIFI